MPYVFFLLTNQQPNSNTYYINYVLLSFKYILPQMCILPCFHKYVTCNQYSRMRFLENDPYILFKVFVLIIFFLEVNKLPIMDCFCYSYTFRKTSLKNNKFYILLII